MAKYQVETEQGTFEIETDDSKATGPDLAQLQAEDKPVQAQFGFEGPATTARQGMEALGGLVGSGGGIQEASDIAQGKPATTLGGKVGKAIGSMAGPAEIGMAAAGGEAMKPILGEAGALVSKLRKPGASKLLENAREMLIKAPGKAAQKEQMLQALLKEQGPAIGAAQKEAGMAMTRVPEAASDVADFANTMKGFAGKTPEELLQVIPPEQLQRLKEVAQVTKRGNILPEAEAFINQGVERIDQAISQAAPKVGEELTKYREIKDALAALPQEAKAEKEALRLAIRKLTEKNKPGLVRKTLELGAKGAGLGAALKLMGGK